jgi:hypothetical protein
MIRRYDVTVGDTLNTPAPGVYITVLDVNGDEAAIYADDGVTAKANPFTSGLDGTFEYWASAGAYTEEYRHSLGGQPKQVVGVTLGPNSYASTVGTNDGSNVQAALDARPTSAALATTAGAAAIGSNDSTSGALWSTVAGFIAYLRSSAGSAILGFIQPGTGAVTRTAQDKMRDTVHLFDFVPVAKQAGILAGSNTDDLSAYFQAALDTGRPVLLPDTGMAWIASPIFVPSGGGLIGNGFNFTIKAKADFGLYAMIRNKTVDPASNSARDTGLIFSGFKIDGNKANNSLSTEFCHALNLRAVDGAYLDIWAVNPKGDGLCLQYAYPLSEDGGTHLGIGCNNIRGFVRSDGAARQGVALVCAEKCDLTMDVTDAGYYGLDLELDDPSNFIRHCHLRLRATNCGLNATGSGGILSVSGTDSAGTGFGDVRNITIDFEGADCNAIQFGAGVNYRDVDGLFLRGRIDNQTGIGIGGLDSVGISRVTFDVDINGGDSNGATLAGGGDILNGSIRVNSPGSSGVVVNNAGGGVLQARIESSASFGLVIGGSTSDMTFPNCQIAGSAESGLLINGTANGNRFPNLRSSGALGFGFGVQETAGSNNRITNAVLTGNAQGPASLNSATSLVEMEPLFGKATIDAASIADGAQGTIGTITVTGAAVGDAVSDLTASVSFAGMHVWGSVTAANTVTVYGLNKTGGAVDLASATWKAFVTQRVMA